MSAGCKIIKCNCKNPYQDSVYGINQRVANHADGKGTKKDRYRYTSCLKEQGGSSK